MALSGQSGPAEGRPFAWGMASQAYAALPPPSASGTELLLVKLQPVQKGGDPLQALPSPSRPPRP